METNLIEQFVIDELKKTRLENKELIKENEELKNKLIILENKPNEEKVFSMAAIGVAYETNLYGYYISKNNIKQYKEALKNKDFGWLEEHYFRIIQHTWNYEIHIGDRVLKMDIYFGYGSKELSVNTIPNSCYKTLEEAQNVLLKQLEEDIQEQESKFEKEEQSND